MPQKISSNKSTITLSKLSSSGKAEAKIIAGDVGIDGAKQAKFLNRAMRQMSHPRLLSAYDRQVREVHQEKLEDRLKEVVKGSNTAVARAEQRARKNSKIVAETERSLKKNDPKLGLILKPSPRNPRATVTHTPEELTDCVVPAFHDFYRVDDAEDVNAYRVARAQTYLAELLLNAFPKGVEVQVAFSTDGKKIMVSSNLDATNDEIRKRYDGYTVKRLIADLTRKYEKKLSSLENVDQDDRAIRHALKLACRWQDVLSTSGTIHVPEKQKDQDGKHAELRIVDDEIYFNNDIAQFHLPSGVREPCMACAIALHEKTGAAPAHTTALWLTAPTWMALKLSEMSVREIAEYMSTRIASLVEEKVRFAVSSRIRGNADDDFYCTTENHAADSDSDLDESELPEAKAP